MTKKLMIVLLILIVGILILHFLSGNFEAEKLELPFVEEDIVSISLNGTSESTAKQTKEIVGQEGIEMIWEFVQSLESSSVEYSSDMTGVVAYSLDFHLTDQSTYKIIFTKFCTEGNKVFYVVSNGEESKTMISTKDLGKIVYE